MSDPVFQFQSDIYGRLSAHGLFADVPIILNERGILADDIENTLKIWTTKAGKKGAAIVVDRPVREVKNPNASGPEFDIILPITAFEFPLVNRATGGTGHTIEELASEVMHLLHGWRTRPAIGQCYCDKDAVTPIIGTDKLIAAEIQIRASVRLAAPQRVATPRFTGNAEAVQITCSTPDATIYWTLDGSFPWSGNAQATRYGITVLTESGDVIVTEDGDPLHNVEPFAIAPGIPLRSAAYHATLQGSDAAYHTF